MLKLNVFMNLFFSFVKIINLNAYKKYVLTESVFFYKNKKIIRGTMYWNFKIFCCSRNILSTYYKKCKLKQILESTTKISQNFYNHQ